MTFQGSLKIGNSEMAALTRLYSLVMACKWHSVSVTQPKVGVVYESNFLKNSEENVIRCLLCTRFTTASAFTSWGHAKLPMNVPSNHSAPSLAKWQGCQMQEKGWAHADYMGKASFAGYFRIWTWSRKTSARFRVTPYWKADFSLTFFSAWAPHVNTGKSCLE